MVYNRDQSELFTERMCYDFVYSSHIKIELSSVTFQAHHLSGLLVLTGRGGGGTSPNFR